MRDRHSCLKLMFAGIIFASAGVLAASVAKYPSSTPFSSQTAVNDELVYLHHPNTTAGAYNTAFGIAVHNGSINFQNFGLAGAVPSPGGLVHIISNGSTGDVEGNPGGTMPVMSTKFVSAGMMNSTVAMITGVPSTDCGYYNIAVSSGSPSGDGYGYGVEICTASSFSNQNAIWNSTDNACEAVWLSLLTGDCFGDSVLMGETLPLASAVGT